jgi:hypothetical protein
VAVLATTLIGVTAGWSCLSATRPQAKTPPSAAAPSSSSGYAADIEQAAERFGELADRLDPTSADVDQTEDLRQIAAACDAVRTDEARLREAVQIARAQGRSWNQIAVALGVSRQAARQRFAAKTHA